MFYLETQTVKDLFRKIKDMAEDEEVVNLVEQLQGELKAITEYLEEGHRALVDDKKIKRVEIIVLKYKEPDIECECISRIIEKTNWPYKLVVFDNRPNNRNTSKIWNKLIKESTCDYILIMDSDAFVETENWLTYMMKTFDDVSNVAAVGPVAGCFGTVTTVQDKEPEQKYLKVDQLSGYCFLTKKSVLEKIGYFDEDFVVFGSDSEWFERAVTLGFNLVVNARVLVYHGKGNEADLSFKKAEQEEGFNWRIDTEIARALFEQKKRMQRR